MSWLQQQYFCIFPMPELNVLSPLCHRILMFHLFVLTMVCFLRYILVLTVGSSLVNTLDLYQKTLSQERTFLMLKRSLKSHKIVYYWTKISTPLSPPQLICLLKFLVIFFFLPSWQLWSSLQRNFLETVMSGWWPSAAITWR